MSMSIGMHLMQPYVVHGGAIYSLADAASTLAVLTRLWPDFWATTVEQSVQFMRPITATKGEIVAFAHVRRFGKTIGRKRSWKKAYVRLAEGQEINFAATE